MTSQVDTWIDGHTTDMVGATFRGVRNHYVLTRSEQKSWVIRDKRGHTDDRSASGNF